MSRRAKALAGKLRAPGCVIDAARRTAESLLELECVFAEVMQAARSECQYFIVEVPCGLCGEVTHRVQVFIQWLPISFRSAFHRVCEEGSRFMLRN